MSADSLAKRRRIDAVRWAVLEQIPIKDWLKMSGRRHKVIYDQAARTGIPFGQSPISLPAVVRALHDFLAHNQNLRLRRADGSAPESVAVHPTTGSSTDDDDADIYSGASSPQLERLRRYKADIERLKLRSMQRELVPADEIHHVYAALAGRLRTVADALERQFGPEAHEILDQALREMQAEVAALTTPAQPADPPNNPTDQPPAKPKPRRRQRKKEPQS